RRHPRRVAGAAATRRPRPRFRNPTITHPTETTTMNFRRTLLSAAAAATVATLVHLPAAAQQVIKLTATAGHPPVFLWVKTMDEVFIPEVDKRLAAAGNKYKIEWTKAWGGTLIKLGS